MKITIRFRNNPRLEAKGKIKRKLTDLFQSKIHLYLEDNLEEEELKEIITVLKKDIKTFNKSLKEELGDPYHYSYEGTGFEGKTQRNYLIFKGVIR